MAEYRFACQNVITKYLLKAGLRAAIKAPVVQLQHAYN